MLMLTFHTFPFRIIYFMLTFNFSLVRSGQIREDQYRFECWIDGWVLPPKQDPSSGNVGQNHSTHSLNY